MKNVIPQMLCACIFFLVSILTIGEAAGAGRAFTVKMENYAIKQFQKVNPNLEWDSTNFLVDLSGQYANCKYITGTYRTPAAMSVDRKTPYEGDDIVAAIDQTEGDGTDVNSVNGYVINVINRWIDSKRFHSHMRTATRFGCSVNPGCGDNEDRVAVSCLFSPAGPEKIEIRTTREPEVPPNNPAAPSGGQTALAFTPEQYTIAELITGNKWDRSHFFENLSGFETDCSMIGTKDWSFGKARSLISGLGLHIVGTFGYSENIGSTPDALEAILKKLKDIQNASKIGCSLIPDCSYDSRMYVVVSCLYEEI